MSNLAVLARVGILYVIDEKKRQNSAQDA